MSWSKKEKEWAVKRVFRVIAILIVYILFEAQLQWAINFLLQIVNEMVATFIVLAGIGSIIWTVIDIFDNGKI